MIRTRSWRLPAATLALAFVLAAWPALPGKATTPTPDPHHPAATPASGDPCEVDAGLGTPAMGHGPHGGPMMTPATGLPHGTPGAGMGMMGEFDLIFIDMMIPHHESAVAMAEVALVRAEREEIRQLAEDIIASQAAEIEQMREWREAWYPDAPAMPMDQMMEMMGGMMEGMPGMPGPDMMGMAMDVAAEVAALCAAPGPFDLAFIEMMIPHHLSAVVMAEVARQRATHDEIKEFAEAIIAEQEREIDLMRAWREAWFGGTPAAD